MAQLTVTPLGEQVLRSAAPQAEPPIPAKAQPAQPQLQAIQDTHRHPNEVHGTRYGMAATPQNFAACMAEFRGLVLSAWASSDHVMCRSARGEDFLCCSPWDARSNCKANAEWCVRCPQAYLGGFIILGKL